MAVMFTNVKEIPKQLVASFRSGKTRDVQFRLDQIKQLVKLIDENEEQLVEAISADGKCKFEASLADLIMTKKEALLFLSNLKAWAQPQRVGLDWLFVASLDGAELVRDPFGVCLVIGTWNYPVNCTLIPLIGAIAGGNCAVLKVNEVCENTSRLLAELLPKYLDQECFKVVTGAVDQATELLKQRWDHIFYTGNTAVGKIIAKAAAEHLTPCVLELGGKNPCFIERGVDIKTAAKRVAYGKFFNCGQTCIAPDYLLIPKGMQQEFIDALKTSLVQMYGDLDEQAKWKDYGRIANTRHWQRLAGYLSKTKGEILLKGEQNKDALLFGPTIVSGVKDGDSLMQEEIFGPILPVIDCESLEDAVEYVTAREKPLVGYIFSDNSNSVQKFKEQVLAGAVSVNDCIIHFSISSLPFGGVGNSGHGRYHGKYSFECFTHEKPFLWRTNVTEAGNFIRYPPYSDTQLTWIKRILVGLFQ